VLTAYRINALNDLTSSIIWSSFSVISILLLTSKTKSVFGWDQQGLLILTACFIVIQGCFNILFVRNFNRFARMIDRAEIDSLLIKPIDAQWSISFWIINFPGIFRIILGTSIIAYIVHTAHIATDIFTWVTFLFLAIFGVILLYSVWFTFATILIWFPRLSNIIEFMYTLTNVSRYPSGMFSQFKNIFLSLFIPLTLAISIPAKLFVHTFTLWDGGILIIVSLLLLTLSRLFWNYSLRHYTSASS
jgi:ABC-2 type transport system permease protein